MFRAPIAIITADEITVDFGSRRFSERKLPVMSSITGSSGIKDLPSIYIKAFIVQFMMGKAMQHISTTGRNSPDFLLFSSI